MNEQALSGVFQALSDPTRRGIVSLLRAGPCSAGQLAEAFPLAKSTLSAHFTQLRYAGLVESERRGRHIVYRLNPAALEEVVGVLNGWLEPPRSLRPASRLDSPPPLPHSPRLDSPRVDSPPSAPAHHPAPQRLRRRGAARVALVEGALAVLLAGLAGRPAAHTPPDASGGAGGSPVTGQTRRPGRTDRRGLGHLLRLGE
jgi:ArsR family transcriptional regulator, arsenate/arsenite/antimonite-responsive transcriptional repressor